MANEIEQVTDLTPAALATSKKVGDADTVLCRNRGRRPVEDTFDGTQYRIPPGLFKCRYDMAKHVQRRAIVPGTRNLQTGGYVSFIGILRSADEREIPVDPPEWCTPFTDHELRQMGERVEGIDRTTGVAVAPLTIGQAMAQTMRSTSPFGGRSGIDLSEQASEEAAARAEEVLAPVGRENLATTEALNEAAADGVAISDDTRARAQAAAADDDRSQQRSTGRRR